MKLTGASILEYHLSTTYLSVGLRTRTVSDIEDAVEEFETDPKIKMNMIGLVPWSLKSWIMDPDKLSKENGQLNLTYESRGTLTSVSCTLYDPFHPVFEMPAVRISTRMWITPRCRNQNYMTLQHTMPGMRWAFHKGVRRVWTSFNSDRILLQRRLEMMKHNENKLIRAVWADWKTYPESVDLNGEKQMLVYRDIEPGFLG